MPKELIPTPLFAEAPNAMEHAMDGICPHCLRVQAIDEDWDNIPEGEGEDLCWEEGYCTLSFNNGLTADMIRLTAVARLLYEAGKKDATATA